MTFCPVCLGSMCELLWQEHPRDGQTFGEVSCFGHCRLFTMSWISLTSTVSLRIQVWARRSSFEWFQVFCCCNRTGDYFDTDLDRTCGPTLEGKAVGADRLCSTTRNPEFLEFKIITSSSGEVFKMWVALLFFRVFREWCKYGSESSFHKWHII